MVPTFEIAQPEDLEKIVEIYNQTIPTRLATADLEPVSVESRIPWFNAHHPQRRPLWSIKIQQTIVGWISLSDFYGRPAYQQTAEISIYIDKEHHGHGLAQQALNYVEKQLPQLQVTVLLAFIFGHNQPSVQLFKKNGFTIWGHLPQVALLDGQPRDLLILGRNYRKND